jgi:transcriptional regulator with XRE-family HTH domain
MSVATRLASPRKQKGPTEQASADAIGLHVTQIKRYETGNSRSFLAAFMTIAKTLRVTTDSLIFEEEEFETDADVTLRFTAIASMPNKQQAVVKRTLEGVVIKYEDERWTSKLKCP